MARSRGEAVTGYPAWLVGTVMRLVVFFIIVFILVLVLVDVIV